MLTEFGFPMGPFAMGDLAGLDVGWRIRKGAAACAEIADRSASWAASARRPAPATTTTRARPHADPDPEVEKIIVDASVRLGVKRRTVSKRKILERLLYPMVNEGARSSRRGSPSAAGRHRRDLGLRGRVPPRGGGPVHWATPLG